LRWRGLRGLLHGHLALKQLLLLGDEASLRLQRAQSLIDLAHRGDDLRQRELLISATFDAGRRGGVARGGGLSLPRIKGDVAIVAHVRGVTGRTDLPEHLLGADFVGAYFAWHFITSN
jgi:hypothetical protein